MIRLSLYQKNGTLRVVPIWISDTSLSDTLATVTKQQYQLFGIYTEIERTETTHWSQKGGNFEQSFVRIKTCLTQGRQHLNSLWKDSLMHTKNIVNADTVMQALDESLIAERMAMRTPTEDEDILVDYDEDDDEEKEKPAAKPPQGKTCMNDRDRSCKSYLVEA